MDRRGSDVTAPAHPACAGPSQRMVVGGENTIVASIHRVMLMIESSRAYGRGCLLGIAAYLRTHGSWEVLHYERSLDERMPPEASQWQPDGVIARIDTDALARDIYSLNVPVVDLLGTYVPPKGAIIRTDDAQSASMAIGHLLERGFRHMAFAGYGGLDWSERRGAAFVHELAEKGYSSYCYSPRTGPSHPGNVLHHESGGEFDEPQLADWLKELPRPVGIFACNDVRGRQVLRACDKAGLAVPDQVAVVGLDNDQVLCELAHPPLSSIEPDSRRLGHQGAQMLQAFMAGEELPPPLVTCPPTRVISRRSSDVVAVEDEELARALQIIRDHACEGLTVNDVIGQVALSRPTLQRRFLNHLGRTPKQQIDRARVERAKQLLIETNYTLKYIARVTGFANAAHFASAFKRQTGQSPKHFAAHASQTLPI